MKTTKRLLKKIEEATPVYMVALWAKWGVREYKWTGKWCRDKDTGFLIPIVWNHYDGNGTCDKWLKQKLNFTTTGYIFDWTFRKKNAEIIADMLNKETNMGKDMYWLKEIKDKQNDKKWLPTKGSSAVPPKTVVIIKHEQEEGYKN